jgi:RNA polymerase sigma factor (sigma-70 family)
VPFLRSHPELLAGFRRGDRSALEAVYWAYVDRVERVVARGHSIARKGKRVEGAGEGNVADLVQEVFLRAFADRARAAYDGVRDYAPYLTVIARNLLTDFARKQGREASFELLDEDDAPAAPEPGDGEAWADAETIRVVENFLEGLDEELRGVHHTRYELGMSQERAAEALGCTRQQFRTREARLRDGLRKALRDARLAT